MGFIFYPPSPRFVSEVPDYLPKYALRVGVFVNPSYREVTQRVRQFELEAVQFHGNASPGMCQTFREQGLTVVRALSATPEKIALTSNYTHSVDFFLFDTPTLKFGGSGRSYDWQILKRYEGNIPFLLSGGLSPQSLKDLQQFRHPALAGYDLNSGFETAPALKDAAAIEVFIKQIR